MNPLATPLEHHHFQRYSSSEEVAGFLRALTAAAGPYAKLERIGQSAQGREILALVCDASAAAPRSRAKLRVLMVGSQHGASEAAGCEALLYLARAVLLGDLQGLLDDFELVLIPNANPDGRELDSSRNGNDININRDYVLLSQPESCALDAAVLRYAPEVVLDAHESASLKRHTLGREGYLTDFEAQFDVANSPAIPPALLRYAETEFLPALIRGVEARGLRTQRYIREITSTQQPITHGGLTVRKFRNKAGLRGALTVLLETPMEPKADSYPTFRNIGARADKQWSCIQTFLAVIKQQQQAISGALARSARLAPRTQIPLNGSYFQPAGSPQVVINLRRRDTYLLAPIAFEDHRTVRAHDFLVLPDAYVITAHTSLFASLLARHQIPFEVVAESVEARLESEIFAGGASVERACEVLDTWAERTPLPVGSLYVPITQSAGRLLPLLLDPRSLSSVFRYAPFARLIEGGQPLFIARVV